MAAETTLNTTSWLRFGNDRGGGEDEEEETATPNHRRNLPSIAIRIIARSIVRTHDS